MRLLFASSWLLFLVVGAIPETALIAEPKQEVDTYTLQVGDNGKTRLEILNKIHNPNSVRMLIEHGLKEGMSVLLSRLIIVKNN